MKYLRNLFWRLYKSRAIIRLFMILTLTLKYYVVYMQYIMWVE